MTKANISDGDLLREFRALLGGIKQIEAAALLGISDATVTSIETGRRSLSDQVKAYIEAVIRGDIKPNDTALSMLKSAIKHLENGDGKSATRLAYAAIVTISQR